MITASPEKVTASPEVASALARASRGEAGFALLTVAGEDEQGVVDRHADPDHRGHVCDEDRHRYLQRDEVDEGAGHQHAGEAERQRQGRRRQRAEDDQEDQGDDREAGFLRLGEILLGDLLETRPDPGCPTRYGVTPPPRCPGRAVLAASPRNRSTDRRTVAAQWQDRRAGALQLAPAWCEAAGVRARCSTVGDLARTPPTAAALFGRAAPGAASQQDREPVRLESRIPLCKASLTRLDWLPGTSKPPPVRWSVCFAAKGSARRQSRPRRRRPSVACQKLASRFIEVALAGGQPPAPRGGPDLCAPSLGERVTAAPARPRRYSVTSR